MEKITIEIETLNSAFELSKEDEVGRILREIADKIERGHTPTKAMDINGNSVGKINYE